MIDDDLDTRETEPAPAGFPTAQHQIHRVDTGGVPELGTSDSREYNLLAQANAKLDSMQTQLDVICRRLQEGETQFAAIAEAIRAVRSHLAAQDVGEDQDPTALKGHHVLVVEDHDYLRVRLVDGLTACGADATGVATVDEGKRFLRNLVPTAVVFDLLLPDGAGVEVAYGALALRDDIKLVCVVGWPNPALEQQVDRMGAKLISKPFQFRRVVGAIRSQAAE